jgi:protein-S-isoprenylcysteine O-methyltransferase Ste14
MKGPDTKLRLLRALEHKIPPPIVALVIALAMWATAESLPAWFASRILRIGLAIVFTVPALIFAGLGVRAFRRAKTTVNPNRPDAATTIVTRGVYRYTRNPMYVGLTFLLLAWATYLAVPWGFSGPAVFVLFTTRFQIIPEERALLAKFGNEYSVYKTRVRRWL